MICASRFSPRSRQFHGFFSINARVDDLMSLVMQGLDLDVRKYSPRQKTKVFTQQFKQCSPCAACTAPEPPGPSLNEPVLLPVPYQQAALPDRAVDQNADSDELITSNNTSALQSDSGCDPSLELGWRTKRRKVQAKHLKDFIVTPPAVSTTPQ